MKSVAELSTQIDRIAAAYLYSQHPTLREVDRDEVVERAHEAFFSNRQYLAQYRAERMTEAELRGLVTVITRNKAADFFRESDALNRSRGELPNDATGYSSFVEPTTQEQQLEFRRVREFMLKRLPLFPQKEREAFLHLTNPRRGKQSAADRASLKRARARMRLLLDKEFGELTLLFNPARSSVAEQPTPISPAPTTSLPSEAPHNSPAFQTIVARLEPVLVIIHTSDWHCGFGNNAHRARMKTLSIFMRTLVNKLEVLKCWEEGTREHDITAIKAMERVLYELSDEAKGLGIPIWLVDSGDGTTFGGKDEIAEYHRQFVNFREYMDLAGYRTIFGNHDTWFGSHPIAGMFDKSAYQQQRELVTRNAEWRPAMWQHQPLQVACPKINCTIRLFAVDSSSNAIFHPIRATGSVDEEFKTLHNAIQSKQAELDGKIPFDILLMHHPLFCPPQISTRMGPISIMKLKNEVTRQFEFNEKNLGRVVLSGHIHYLFPEQGALQPTAVNNAHGQMGPNNMQYTAGPLMLPHNEIGMDRGINTNQQQFQVLKFYVDPQRHQGDGLYIGRTLYARTPERLYNDYEPQPLHTGGGNDEGSDDEQLVFYPL